MADFSNQFWNGELYPRWLIDMYEGNGSPIMFFYSPLPYWVGVFSRPLAALDAFGYFPIAASGCIAVFASGIAFFYWLKDIVGPMPALPASLLYMAFPFHVGYAFYFILILGTVWAYALLPLLFYFAQRIALNKPFGIAGFEIALCLLVMSNVPATIIMGPASVFYGFIHCPTSRWRCLLKFATATILGFALAAFYVYPAFAYKAFVTVDLQWVGPLNDYARRFVIPGFANPSQAFYFTVWLSVLAVTLFFFFSSKLHLRSRMGCLGLICFALLLMMDILRPLWERLEILQALQHPARLFIVPALLIPVLAAMAFYRMPRVIWGMVALSTVVTVVMASQTRTSPQSFQRDQPEEWKEYNLQIDQYPFYLSSRSLIPRYYTPEGIEETKKNLEQTTVVDGHATSGNTRLEAAPHQF